MAAGTTSTTETSSAPTAASATITAPATAASNSRSGPLTARPRARTPSGSKARASHARRSAAWVAEREHRGDRGQPQVAVAEPDQRPEQQPVDARAGAVDVRGQERAERERGDEQDARGGVLLGLAPARHALAQAREAERGAERRELRRDPHAEATTRPGNVAVPTEWVKNASRRSTIQPPSTPASTASSTISTSARCM